MNSIKLGTFVRGRYDGNQNGVMQFICAYRSGSTTWFLGTDSTIGTIKYSSQYNCKVFNNDSLKWSDACACSWKLYLYLKSGPIEVENCKIPTQSEAYMINQLIRNNGFPYWTSTKQDDSHIYTVNEHGHINAYTNIASELFRGVVPLAKISL